MFCKKILWPLLLLISFSAFATDEVFIEPNAGYAPVLNEINAAKNSIKMSMYLLKDKQIISALINAKERGVEVRVILEKKPYGEYYRQPYRVRQQLENAGISVKWNSPHYFYLTHEKAFTVDNKELVIMTFNQTYSAYHFNREYGVIDSNHSEIYEFLKVFEGDWHRAYPVVLVQDLVWSPNNSTCKLIKLIKSAQHFVRIESEELENKAIEDLLVQRAHHNINIRIIFPPQKNQRKLQHLVNNGIHVEIMPKRPLYMHAKMIIIDNSQAFIGSENLTSTSLQMNRELGVLIHSDNHLQKLTNTFESDWNRAKPLTFNRDIDI